MTDGVDQKARDDLGEHETECEKRYGEIKTALAEMKGELNTAFSGINRDLKWIKWIFGIVSAFIVPLGLYFITGQF